MKHKLFFLSLLSLFLFMGCNKDRITLEILTPKKGEILKMYNDIDVKVTATTQKGSITQVILMVDTLKRFDLYKAPYDVIIPAYTFKDTGVYFISVTAYSSEGVMEGDAIDIVIKK